MENLLDYFKINEYPDGSSYVEFEQPYTYKSNSFKSVDRLYRIESYNDLWILSQINDVLKFKSPKDESVKMRLWVPNLLDAQADRRFSENQSWGLPLICDFLSNLESFHYMIFHPHNPDVVKSLMRDKVDIIDNNIFIKQVIKELDKSNLALMSPDAGAYKPLMKLADILGWVGDVYSASKFRTYVDGESKVLQHISETDFGCKDILLIDDLCMRGGTLIGLAKMLRERNVGKLYCAFSHLTVSDPREELFEIYDKVFTTNSKKCVLELESKYDNLKVINNF